MSFRQQEGHQFSLKFLLILVKLLIILSAEKFSFPLPLRCKEKCLSPYPKFELIFLKLMSIPYLPPRDHTKSWKLEFCSRVLPIKQIELAEAIWYNDPWTNRNSFWSAPTTEHQKLPFIKFSAMRHKQFQFQTIFDSNLVKFKKFNCAKLKHESWSMDQLMRSLTVATQKSGTNTRTTRPKL